jgi:hypothetical protein
VVASHGMGALEWLWVDEDRFPTLAELREPQLWLRRVA